MNTCDQCGINHDWRDCPRFNESVFYGEEPEWIQPEVDDLLDELAADPDPLVRRMMEQRLRASAQSCKQSGTASTGAAPTRLPAQTFRIDSLCG